MNNIPQLPPILDFNNETNKGMLFDTRDGQSYQVVKIGSQIWLAENFRYLPSIKDKGDLYENSWIYENNTDYLEKGYGRLYDWDTAMNIAPEGWKLPNNLDFIELKEFIIKDNKLNVEKVGSYLKSVNGWELCDGIVNNDKYGFNAKPAGYRSNTSNYFHNAGTSANFWSATKISGINVNSWYLNYYNEVFNDYSDNKCYGFNVRLIKDI